MIKRGFRALLVGATVCLLSFAYLPHCGLRIAPQDIDMISYGVSGILTILIYRFA